jgi:hypothetical protein
MMPWTSKQKQLAVRACHAARIDEDQRRDLILRNFANARLPDGRISSTSSRLNNSDFEQFMAIVESYAGGQVLHFTRRYWQGQARDRYHRMRARALAIAAELEARGLLHAGGAGLAGWIQNRVTRGATARIEDLDYHGLLALNLSPAAYARQHGIGQPAGLSADDVAVPGASESAQPTFVNREAQGCHDVH